METIETIAGIRERVNAWKREGLRVGFVPTMGNLHSGHLALVDAAREHSDRTVASIFVNPTQFGPGEDYESYPRTLEADLAQLEQKGTDLVFAPPVEEIYPGGEPLTWVNVDQLDQHLCGASRPGHFRGVATVVTKLFNLVRPDVAVFGEKDAQQVAVIRRVVADLDMDLELVIEPTHREPDGLAISSRNRFLDDEQRRQAPAVHRALKRAAESLAGGHTVAATLAGARHWLVQQGFEVDYLVYVDDERFEEQARPVCRGRLLVAARLGRVRLIDNLAVHMPQAGDASS